MIKATIQNNPYCTEMTFPCTETELSEKLGEIGIDKEDKVNHGFGLTSVGEVVEKNNGTVKIETDENVFTITVALYVQ